MLPLCFITLRFSGTCHPTTVSPSDGFCPFCSQPSFQETPRCLQKEPHVPQLSSLLSLSLGSSFPFSNPIPPLPSIPPCGCPELWQFHQDSNKTGKNEGITFFKGSLSRWILLPPPASPSYSSHPRECVACLPSFPLHPITNTAVDHLFPVLEALPVCDLPSWLQFFTLFLVAGCFPISLCNSKHTSSTASPRVFYLPLCLLKVCSF